MLICLAYYFLLFICSVRTASGNRKFIEELTKWTFQEKSVLDVVAVQHHKVGEEEAPAHYRIKDNMVIILLHYSRTKEQSGKSTFC